MDDLKSNLGYVWTGAKGAVHVYLPDPTATKAVGDDTTEDWGKKCVINDATGWAKGVGQKVTFTISTVENPKSLLKGKEV